MELHPTGREYAYWPVSDAPAEAAFEVSFNRGADWHPTTRPDTGEQAVALVAGPASTDNPAETIVLRRGPNHALLRIVDSPEVPVRNGGMIYVG